ncbi:MAG: Bax inhibitor-1/YccA family protein [bacterium]
MRTANPALNARTFEGFGHVAASGDVMTIQGTVNKTGFLLLFLVISALWTWKAYYTAGPGAVLPWMAAGAIGGFVFALLTVFKKQWAGVTAPVYALLEGLFLGGLSAILEGRFHGIVIQAVCLTFGTLFFLLMAYKSGAIRATENFKLGVVAATGGIFLIYLFTWLLGIFGVNIPYIHSSGLVGIAFSVFVVIVAALNLVLDFDFIENGSEKGAPKYMEWYAAFGLMVTLVWLYVEILRLLVKLRERK